MPMATSNPTIFLNGRLGSAPEQRTFSSNKVTRFRLATNDRKKDESGSWVDVNTSWWDIEVWGVLGDKVMTHLEKGDPVIISGKIIDDEWSDGSGKITKVVKADDIGLNILLAK